MVCKVEEFRLTLLGKDITPATVAKDLGVLLDPCLTYNKQLLDEVEHDIMNYQNRGRC